VAPPLLASAYLSPRYQAIDSLIGPKSDRSHPATRVFLCILVISTPCGFRLGADSPPARLGHGRGERRRRRRVPCHVHPRPGLMKIVSFGGRAGLTSGPADVALSTVVAGLPAYGEFAWTRPHGRASRPMSQPIQLPSRFKLGSSDAAATVGRRSTRSSRWARDRSQESRDGIRSFPLPSQVFGPGL
jgi:hypothetical protein